MKELDALMKALDERGIPESLRKTTKLVPFPKEKDTPEKKQALLDEAVRHCLAHHMAHDDELNHLFADFTFELGMNALIKELDIKAPEESPDFKKILEELLKNL